MGSKVARSDLKQLLIPVIGAYLLLWVAVLNGYPMLFPDSGMYLVRSFTLEVPIHRPVFYSVFMRVTSFGITPWLVVGVQSVITVFVLWQCLHFLFAHKIILTRKRRLLTGIVLGLAFGTSLPWFVGLLMPDIFTGLLILCMFLLLYDSQLTAQTSVALSFILLLSIACHLSHLLIAGIILLALGGLRLSRHTRCFWPTRSMKQVCFFVLTPILAGAFAVALSNRYAGRGFVLSPGGHMFMVGRLFASGMAGKFLQQDCKREPLMVCRYLDNLPSDEEDFLWHQNPVFKAMGGWLNSKNEATRIIVGTIRYQPIRFLRECIKQSIRQFLRMKSSDGTNPYPLFVIDNLKMFYPAEIPKCQASLQWMGRLEKLATRLSGFYTAAFWCSMGVCLIFLAVRWGYADAANKLFIFVLISLCSNAAITGNFAGVHDRYESRVSWLMAFCAISYLVSTLARQQSLGEQYEEVLQINAA